MGIQGRPDPAGTVRQFGPVGRFDGGAHVPGRQVGQAAAQRPGARQAGTAEQGGQQRLDQVVEVEGPAAAQPGQHQPEQDRGVNVGIPRLGRSKERSRPNARV
jgi:hypothetical protein